LEERQRKKTEGRNKGEKDKGEETSKERKKTRDRGGRDIGKESEWDK
jgi:hypothetical protein